MGLVYCLSHDIDNNFYLRHCMSTTFQLHTAGLHLAMVLITTNNIVLTIVCIILLHVPLIGWWVSIFKQY